MSQEIQIFYPNIVLQDIYALLINFSKIHSHRFFFSPYLENHITIIKLLLNFFSPWLIVTSPGLENHVNIAASNYKQDSNIKPNFCQQVSRSSQSYNHPAQYKSGLPDKATKVEGHLNADVRMVENLKAVDLWIC